MKRYSLDAQIAEIERELIIRDRVFADRVATRKMKAGEAEYRIDCLRAVMRTLEWLKRNEVRVRSAIGADDTPETGKAVTEQQEGANEHQGNA